MKYCIGLLVTCLTGYAFSTPPGYWQCMAFDSKQQSFSGVGESMEQAMFASKVKCQNNSPVGHCKSAQSYCEQGPLSLSDDDCLVTDDDGHAWDTTGDNACRTALLMCNRFLALEGGPRGQCSVKHGGGDN